MAKFTLEINCRRGEVNACDFEEGVKVNLQQVIAEIEQHGLPTKMIMGYGNVVGHAEYTRRVSDGNDKRAGN